MSEANPSGASQLSVVRGRRIYLVAKPSISQKVGKAGLVKGQNEKARLQVPSHVPQIHTIDSQSQERLSTLIHFVN